MLKIEALRDELILVANVVKDHKEVAETTNNSLSFLAQIRSGKNVKANTKKNIQLIQNLIDAYRKIGWKKNQELEKVLQKTDKSSIVYHLKNQS